MTLFPHNVKRFPDLFEVYFRRWAHSARIELEYMSDEDLNDISLERPMRVFETIKPFWMPLNRAGPMSQALDWLLGRLG